MSKITRNRYRRKDPRHKDGTIVLDKSETPHWITAAIHCELALGGDKEECAKLDECFENTAKC